MESGQTYLDGATKSVEECIRDADIHRIWSNAYRTSDNSRFFALAFRFVQNALGAPKNSVILDAGCGTCSHAIRLALHNYRVLGIDISASILSAGMGEVQRQGLRDRVDLSAANLRSLPFRDSQFSFILCWGVLMHIPDIRQTIAELSRVLARGGRLVICENNMHSIQSLGIRAWRALRGKERTKGKRTAAGMENWYQTKSGMLLTRETDMSWLVENCGKNGLVLKDRVAGQLSDLYAWPLFRFFRRPIHTVNLLWFKYVRSPRLALGNILVFQKI
jgi:2-polyprenyl-3-methyl-5-hydroxy-6-metoxy-1,4-benzoquinol methylase